MPTLTIEPLNEKPKAKIDEKIMVIKPEQIKLES